MKWLLPAMLITVMAACSARAADSVGDDCAARAPPSRSGGESDASIRIARWNCILSVSMRARHIAGLALWRHAMAVAEGKNEPSPTLDQQRDAENAVELNLRQAAAKIPDRPSPFYSEKTTTPPEVSDWDGSSCSLRTADSACGLPALYWGKVTYHFTDPVVMMYDYDVNASCDQDDPRCVKEAVKYYTTLGIYQSDDGRTRVAKPYRSFGEWRAWAFDGGIGPDVTEAHVAYHNSPDLALGRDMHCIRHQRPDLMNGQPMGVVAVLLCYVANYNDGKAPAPGSDRAKAAWNAAAGDSRVDAHGSKGAHDQVAVVAMQSVISREEEGLSSDVSFVVFAPPANASDRSIDRFQVSPQVLLDGEAPKALPGACLPCHGGSYVKNVHRVAGAHFLPFDVGTLGVAPDPRSYQEPFRQLNALVRTRVSESRSGPWTSC